MQQVAQEARVVRIGKEIGKDENVGCVLGKALPPCVFGLQGRPEQVIGKQNNFIHLLTQRNFKNQQ